MGSTCYMLSHVDGIPGVPGNKVMYTVSTHIQAKFASMRTHTHIHTNKKYVFNSPGRNRTKRTLTAGSPHHPPLGSAYLSFGPLREATPQRVSENGWTDKQL